MTGRETLKLLLLTALLAMGGMAAMLRRSEEPIRKYTVERPPPSHRMLAAIIPAGQQAWFFKLTGPFAALSQHEESFRALIKSVRFADPAVGPPAWELPSGWSQQPGDQARFATLEVPSDVAPLECTVTVLPMKNDAAGYLLDNINRWRGQLGLAPLRPDELGQATSIVPVSSGGMSATVVDLAGEMSASGGAGRAPFAAGGATSPRSVSSDAVPALKYDVPAGWVPGELEVSRGGISVRRAAAFEVREGDARLEITVTRLPASALAANVNRWRAQIGLGELSPEQYQQEKKSIDYAGQPADYLQFFGEREAILGVISVGEGMAWFVKLQGPVELARREQPNFEAFVHSIRLD